MKRPRVLCLMQLPPPVHGASVVNRAVATSKLLASRFDLDVLPLEFAGSIEDIGRVSARKVVRAITTAARLGHRLTNTRPDLVYFTFSADGPAFFRDLGFVAVLKAFRVPTVLHLHGNASSSRRITRVLRAWAVNGTSIIHLSPRVQLDRRVLRRASRIAFVPNGIPDRAGAPVRHVHGGPVRILFLSNMLVEKGPLVLLEALDLLARDGISFEATFAGAPVAETLKLFESEVAARGLAGYVRYVGAVHGPAKEQLFRTHDVFAFPTYYRREIFPLVLLEAMQWGMPTVATNTGAIADIVLERDTGFVVEPRDARMLAARLRTLINEPATRLAMGTKARERFVAAFTAERFESTMAETLEACLE